MLLGHYRKNLRAVVGSAAAPYGYTLSIWAAGAALVSVHGIPRTLAALTFVGGAVLGFAFVGALAYGGIPGQLDQEGPRPPLGKPPLCLCRACDRGGDTSGLPRRGFFGLASGWIFGYEHLPSRGRSRVRHYLPVGA